MPLIPYQGPVQQLTPTAADPAFHDRIHPRRLDRGADNPDARGLEHRVECGGDAGVPVVHDELCPCPCVFQVHDQVPGLLNYPRLDRMLGGSEDPDAAGAVLDDGKDVDLGGVEQVAVKKSSARIPCAWDRRNSAQPRPSRRS